MGKKILDGIKNNKRFAIGYCAVLAVGAVLPLLIRGSFTLHVLIMCMTWSILGTGWNFIGGYAGQVSNGHALYYAIGAYACALSMKWWQLTPWISMWIGVAISVALAFIVGTPLLRLRGHYFAISTMALAECGRIIFLNTKSIGGATGVDFLNKNLPQWYSMQFTDKQPYYYILLVFLALLVILVKVLDKSRFGYYCRAIKANQDSAESVGINTSFYKIIAYMLSAGIVSLAGSLYAQYMLYIDPSMLMPLNISMMIVLVCVMGGIGTVVGPILGAFVLTTISEYTRTLYAQYRGMDLFIYGVLVILVVLFLPNGIISLFKRKHPKTDAVPVEDAP